MAAPGSLGVESVDESERASVHLRACSRHWPLPRSFWLLNHPQNGFPKRLQEGPGAWPRSPSLPPGLTRSVRLQNSSSLRSIPSMVSSTSFAWKETISWRLANGFQGDKGLFFFFFG